LVQDRTGRKWTLCIGSFISIAAIAVCYIADMTANKQATFWGGKLLEGVAVGVIMCSTQTYLSEVVPARLRGPVFALFPAFQLVGQLVAAVAVLVQLNAEGRNSYRVALASEWPFSAIPLVLAFVLPESPAWLIHKDKISAARSSFRKLHGEAVALAHQDLFEDMHRAVAEERRAANDRKATYMECFRGTNLKRTGIVIFANTYEVSTLQSRLSNETMLNALVSI
jgi:MFS family permease